MQGAIFAQDSYEIQVYESETEEKGNTFLELHSNYTPQGSTQYTGNIFPSNQIWHETVEITHGFTDCFETGFYLFNALGSDGRTGFAGMHIRPRVRAPESWEFPVGLSLSSEFGYRRLGFFNNHWLFEINPIIDKKIGKFYFSVNPTFDWDIDVTHDLEFNPCYEATYQLVMKFNLGLEWYSSYGNVADLLPWDKEHQVLFLATNIDFGKDWEFNAGIGRGLSPATDPWIVKMHYRKEPELQKESYNGLSSQVSR